MNLLYKYYSLDKLFDERTTYSIQDLIDGKVSFVSLISFNDPFEGYGRYSDNNYLKNECNSMHKIIAESYAWTAVS